MQDFQTPVDMLDIEARARQMRAEAFHGAFAALGRGIVAMVRSLAASLTSARHA